jgi:hypothetical protein
VAAPGLLDGAAGEQHLPQRLEPPHRPLVEQLGSQPRQQRPVDIRGIVERHEPIDPEARQREQGMDLRGRVLAVVTHERGPRLVDVGERRMNALPPEHLSQVRPVGDVGGLHYQRPYGAQQHAHVLHQRAGNSAKCSSIAMLRTASKRSPTGAAPVSGEIELPHRHALRHQILMRASNGLVIPIDLRQRDARAEPGEGERKAGEVAPAECPEVGDTAACHRELGLEDVR